MSRGLRIEVCCALRERQLLVALQVPQGTTLAQAVMRAGVAEQFPQLDLAQLALGVHGKQRRADELVRDGDRVELYRPLTADPKTARRARAAASRKR